MTVTTTTREEVERLAFEHHALIHIGAHEADVTVDGHLYVARLGGDA